MKINLILLSLIVSIAISRKIQRRKKVVEVEEAIISNDNIKQYYSGGTEKEHIDTLLKDIKSKVNIVKDDFSIKITLNKQNSISKGNYERVCMKILHLLSEIPNNSKHEKRESPLLYKIYFVNDEEKYQSIIDDETYRGLLIKLKREGDTITKSKISSKDLKIDCNCYYVGEFDNEKYHT